MFPSANVLKDRYLFIWPPTLSLSAAAQSDPRMIITERIGNGRRGIGSQKNVSACGASIRTVNDQVVEAEILRASPAPGSSWVPPGRKMRASSDALRMTPLGLAIIHKGDKQSGRSIQLGWSSARKNRPTSDVEVYRLSAVLTAVVLFSPLAGVFVRAAAVVDHAFVPDVGVVAVV